MTGGGLQQLNGFVVIGGQKFMGPSFFWLFKISRNFHEIPIVSRSLFHLILSVGWMDTRYYQYHIFNDWLFFLSKSVGGVSLKWFYTIFSSQSKLILVSLV